MLSNRWSRRRVHLLAAGLALVIAALPLSGCKEVESETAAGYEPSHSEEIKGSKDDLHRITFTAEGARRTGVKTEPVRAENGRTVLPYAALIYDAEGGTYAYTSPKTREYVRAKVKVANIDGNRVFLSEGPPAGTEVVTVGAAEVYGTELDVAGSH